MSLTRIPLPSFALVLTSDVTFIPTRPSVIRFGFDPLQTVHPAPSTQAHASNDPSDTQLQQSSSVPAADDQSLFDVLNDSATDVGQPEGDGEFNTRTERSVSISCGSYSNSAKLEFMTLAGIVRKMLRAMRKIHASRAE
ncbi:hypothetical protein M413DRAFT_438889 [Hebeloma cylindrosporum]|uniref:Uncharacterized protein n=1 Tax=Hebeloma cylindrosporum TaxID=76867 RepID=A0A0C3D005_HEBCY|nr:hypothetical protein M413DRAFT_438889 [Hebeloma cylindrosporum h7]